MISDYESVIKSAKDSPEFLAISGSKLYGSSTPESDTDIRGFFIPPFSSLVGIPIKGIATDCIEFDGDHKVFALKRFLELVISGDPQTSELFFTPEDRIIHITKVGRQILTLRDSIISKNISRRILGFSNSEWRKAMGVKLSIPKRTKTEDEVVEDIRNSFDLDKDSMDHVVDILFSNHKKEMVPSKSGIGLKKLSQFDKCGYGSSSACHAIRLLGQIEELMLTGSMTFPRNNAEMLLSIKKGEVEKKEVESIYKDTLSKAENAIEKSVLRDKPDVLMVYELYADIIKGRLVMC